MQTGESDGVGEVQEGKERRSMRRDARNERNTNDSTCVESRVIGNEFTSMKQRLRQLLAHPAHS